MSKIHAISLKDYNNNLTKTVCGNLLTEYDKVCEVNSNVFEHVNCEICCDLGLELGFVNDIIHVEEINE